ncbi:MAG: recombinase family protein [Oligoflexus sp.]|nr:recombinase family protein [Oligoflexus sp.]
MLRILALNRKLVPVAVRKILRPIVFDKVDRAVRGFKSAVIVEELIDDFGVKFHFTRESLKIDASSPPAEKMRSYLSTILAKYYIDNLKVEIKKGLNEREEEGYWNHKAPLGYLNVTDLPSKKAVVIVDPVEGPAVKKVFELYATGNYSMPMLIEQFNRSTVQNRTWKAMEKVLKNPFYYGIMKTKERLRPGNHQALVSKELWTDCQKIHGIQASQHAKNDKKRALQKPFMGVIHCFECRHRITGGDRRQVERENLYLLPLRKQAVRGP